MSDKNPIIHAYFIEKSSLVEFLMSKDNKKFCY